MLSFASDYIAGAHPAVLQKLCETNLENLSGYDSDPYCESAAQKIKTQCGCPNADVFFLVGGTQTNQVVISTMLRPYEGVLCVKSGHINVHEAGAIEYTGHKVLALDGHDGKLSADIVSAYLRTFYADDTYDHMVFPGMVYISYPTEYGTLYSKSELESLYAVCRENHLSLFIDGARLGYGLAASGLTLADIASLCDVFYIGGTKVGALCGEAVVFPHGQAPLHFMTQVKQHGAMLAKGRLLGVQFDALMADDLYLTISRHAIDMAKRLVALFKSRGYRFLLDSPTNQQFIILDNATMHRLSKNVIFSVWEPCDTDHTAVRFATSWSTTEDDLKALEALL